MVVRIVDGRPVKLGPVAGVGILSAIACPSTMSCLAVGSGNPAHKDEAAIVTLAGGVGRATTFLRVENAEFVGSACPTPTTCTAVGNVNGQRGTAGLLVRVAHGRPEVVHRLPGAGLPAVACTSSSRCVATGEVRGAGALISVADGHPGARRVAPSTSSLGAEGISCPSASTCVVVGAGGSADGELVVLH